MRSLKDLFSERKITVVAGDSTKSIPDFTSVRDPSFQCQLTFIDGGHTRAVFEADLRHMKQLADPAFHVVVVDDLDMGDVLEVFQEWAADGRLVDSYMLDNLYVTDNVSWQMHEDGTHYEFDPRIQLQIIPGKMGIARYSL